MVCSAAAAGVLEAEVASLSGRRPMFAALALLALILEAVAGYPDAIQRRIGHPVEWIGALITHAERAWNLRSLPFERRRLNGVLALAVVLLVTLSVAVLLVAVAELL